MDRVASEWLVAIIEIGHVKTARVIFARDRQVFLDEYPSAKFRDATDEEVASPADVRP